MCMAGLCDHAADTCLLELVRIDKEYAKEPDKVQILERVKEFAKDYLKPILLETKFQSAVEMLTENSDKADFKTIKMIESLACGEIIL